MSEIKIITAFFDIGRGDFVSFNRTNQQYLDYFKHWARIQNDLIVYCESIYAEPIMTIRASFGLDQKTEVRIVDDIYEKEPLIFQKMSLVEEDDTYNNFRYYNGSNPSNMAKYNYIMLMKWWCMQDAASRLPEDTVLAWVDFGYDHGGDRYTDSNDFDFLWELDVPEKIINFCLSNPDDISMIESLQYENNCFLGHTAILPQKMCTPYYEAMCNAMRSLLMIGCMDDDQYLMLMVYRWHPDWFDIRICDWFEDFALFSGHSFTQKIKESNIAPTSAKKVSIIRRGINKVKRIVHKLKAPEYHLSPFILRVMQTEKKYFHWY